MKWLVRWAIRLAYLAMLGVVFVLASYLAFSHFVRRGVIRVPELEGLTQTEGVRLLADRGLMLQHVPDSDRFDEGHELGRIVSQKPTAGTLVKRGGTIRIGLSQGAQRVEVPELRGMAVQAAQVTVAASGLPAGGSVSVFSDLGEAGTVVDQDPSPGEDVDRETAIHLMVARGSSVETYVMPDLIYRPYEELRKAFERLELRLGNVRFEPYEGVRGGVILRQFPLPGHPLRKQDGVFLVVSAEESVEVAALP